jgi:hypothetical protein
MEDNTLGAVVAELEGVVSPYRRAALDTANNGDFEVETSDIIRRGF